MVNHSSSNIRTGRSRYVARVTLDMMERHVSITSSNSRLVHDCLPGRSRRQSRDPSLPPSECLPVAVSPISAGVGTSVTPYALNTYH